MQGYKFPHYAAESLVARAPRLDPDGIVLKMNIFEQQTHGIPDGTIIRPIQTSINWCILPGIGLLASFLSFEARKRISAREAMRNPYFDSLGPGVALLKDSECC